MMLIVVYNVLLLSAQNVSHLFSFLRYLKQQIIWIYYYAQFPFGEDSIVTLGGAFQFALKYSEQRKCHLREYEKKIFDSDLKFIKIDEGMDEQPKDGGGS